MNKRKCGVEPCPMCKKTPLAIDTGLGVTIGCATNRCKYYFVAKDRTLERALIIWNEKARKEKEDEQKKNSIEYCKGFEFAMAVSQGEKDTDEGPDIWSSDFTVGYLDFFMQELMDIKADMGRINSELRNEIAKLREENRKIDKEETEFVPSPTCPSCGNASMWAGCDNRGHWICGVCGAEVTYGMDKI